MFGDSDEFVTSVESRGGNAMDVVVARQTFEGYWASSDELLHAMGTNRSQLSATLSKTSEAWVTVLGQDSDLRVATTVCVLVFLKKRLSAEKETWEMMADKACDWLASQLGKLGVDLTAVEAAVEPLV
jgi:hypothetical protein